MVGLVTLGLVALKLPGGELIVVSLLACARSSRAGLISPSVIIESVVESPSPWPGGFLPFLLGMDE